MKEISHFADPVRNSVNIKNDYLDIFNKKSSLLPMETELDMFSILSGRTMNTAAIKGDLTNTMSIKTNSQKSYYNDVKLHPAKIRDYTYTPNIKPSS